MVSSVTNNKKKNGVGRGGGGGGEGGGGGGPAPFLMKTYRLVDDGGFDEVISWGEKGTSFVVWKPVEFASDLLPVHFKHNNFSSFIRQLNTYGFHKVVPDRWEFANENFRQGEQSLLCNIRRRKTVPPHKPSAVPRGKANASNTPAGQVAASTSLSNSVQEVHSSSTGSSPPALLPPPALQPPKHLLELTNENEMLRKDNQVLQSELAQVKVHFHVLLGHLSKFADVGQLISHNLLAQGKLASSEVLLADNGKSGWMREVVEQKGKVMVKEQGLKLFGVLLKGIEEEDDSNVHGKKRMRCDEEEAGGYGIINGERPMKIGFGLPWTVRSTAELKGVL